MSVSPAWSSSGIFLVDGEFPLEAEYGGLAGNPVRFDVIQDDFNSVLKDPIDFGLFVTARNQETDRDQTDEQSLHAILPRSSSILCIGLVDVNAQLPTWVGHGRLDEVGANTAISVLLAAATTSRLVVTGRVAIRADESSVHGANEDEFARIEGQLRGHFLGKQARVRIDGENVDGARIHRIDDIEKTARGLDGDVVGTAQRSERICGGVGQRSCRGVDREGGDAAEALAGRVGEFPRGGDGDRRRGSPPPMSTRRRASRRQA